MGGVKLWDGGSEFPGCSILVNGSGVSELRTPTKTASLGRLVKVGVPRFGAEAQKLTAQLTVRITDAEKAAIKRKAEAVGLTESDYIRTVLAAQP